MKNRSKAATAGLQPVVFDMTSNQCVWASAGVISPRVCINAFNCLNCPIDQKMQKMVEQKDLTAGPAYHLHVPVEERTVTPAAERKCRHMLSGRVSAKYCTHNYDCANCAYHQMMTETDSPVPESEVDDTYAGGFRLAKRYYYHRGHAWARIEYGGRIRIGLDDFATRLVGRLDNFRLPELGSTVVQGEPGPGFSKGEFKAESLSPAEGIVVATNPGILKNAELANTDPYGKGWLIIVEPTRLKKDLKNLLFDAEGNAWMEDESRRLASLIQGESGHRLAATGGRAVKDIASQLPEIGWDRLVRMFLLTG
ncbi:MAG: glycine cleavage system protein H [Desulfarculaceae bacterium]|nr:glycine cleavage system protein H [Desulfarculaceae bacterium]